MQGMFIGIKTSDNNIYRVDCRRSLIQKGYIRNDIDLLYFKDVPSINIRQCVESLKAVSQLSFKDPEINKVFEIEIHQLTRNVEILLTDVTTGATRLLEDDEFKVVITNNWDNIFDEYGNLTKSSIFDIYPNDLSKLCNLSKDIINIGMLFYIKNGGDNTNIRINMSDIIQLVVSFNDYIAAIPVNENTPMEIHAWFLQGCPLNMNPDETIPGGGDNDSNHKCCGHFDGGCSSCCRCNLRK